MNGYYVTRTHLNKAFIHTERAQRTISVAQLLFNLFVLIFNWHNEKREADVLLIETKRDHTKKGYCTEIGLAVAFIYNYIV